MDDRDAVVDPQEPPGSQLGHRDCTQESAALPTCLGQPQGWAGIRVRSLQGWKMNLCAAEPAFPRVWHRAGWGAGSGAGTSSALMCSGTAQVKHSSPPTPKG